MAGRVTETDAGLLLQGATWLEDAAAGANAVQGDIRISGGRIVALGRLSPEPGETVLDATRTIALPGLFDAVTDTSLQYCAGCLDATDPGTALAHLAAARAALDPALEAERTAAAAEGLLAAGTTEAVDVVRAGPALAARVAARRSALAASGLRADLAVEIAEGTSAEDLTALAAVFAAKAENSEGMVRLQVATLLPTPGAVDATIARITAVGGTGRDLYLLAPETAALPDTAHMLDAARALARATAATGGRTVACGLPLRTASDAAAAAGVGLTIAITPEAEALLGRPRADGRILADAGVDVRLGSGVVSNGGAGMQSIMRLATMLDRPCQQSVDEWLNNRLVLAFATRDRSGAPRRLAPGAPADLALYDRGAAVWTPVNNIDDQIVSSETGASVVLTIVDGRVVWRRNGAVPTHTA